MSKSRNSPVLEEMAWGPIGWVLAADNLFWVSGLTIMAVIEKEGFIVYHYLEDSWTIGHPKEYH